jgi:hypothetical protein
VSSFAQRKHSDLTFSEKTGFCFCLICIRIFPPLRESSLFFPRFFPGTASAAPVPLSFRRLFAWIETINEVEKEEAEEQKRNSNNA